MLLNTTDVLIILHSDTTSISTCFGYLLSNGRLFEENSRNERWALVMMWIFHERILQTIVWLHNWGPVHREWIKEGLSFGKHDAIHIALNFNFQTNTRRCLKIENKVVDPKIEFAFHFGISAFLFFSLWTYVLRVLREKTTMARNMHVYVIDIK